MCLHIRSFYAEGFEMREALWAGMKALDEGKEYGFLNNTYACGFYMRRSVGCLLLLGAT